jgi:hypothetical protein
LASETVVAYAGYEGGRSAQAGHGHSLVGSLAALVGHEVVSDDGLAWCRQVVHADNKVGVATADHYYPSLFHFLCFLFVA